jgi:CubicO group peptidase (beta-lactamase class C family)
MADARMKPHTHPSPRPRLLTLAILSLCLTAGILAYADDVDNVISKQMRDRNIAGLSLAIIQDGIIVKAQGYGFTDKRRATPVTSATLFQAGSISKPVAAVAALHLVEQGQLSLEADVNTFLRTWKVPDNQFTKQKPVTLREILSHSAGMTVHGFAGYNASGPVPTLAQVLDGVPPANSPPIRVDIVPGRQQRYSGGGYTVMQQMVLDVTGRPFPDFLRDTVLIPFGMTNSSYEQPLPGQLASATATGFFADGKQVPGRWHVYPEMAAAGLWTTTSDLARFVIGIQQSLKSGEPGVISQSTARSMLTNQAGNAGFGLFLAGAGKTLSFSHDGRDAGFDAFMIGFAETGQGAVIMMNANDNSGAMNAITKAITEEYHWP